MNNFVKYSFFNIQDFYCCINAINFYIKLSFKWNKILLIIKKNVGKENMDK